MSPLHQLLLADRRATIDASADTARVEHINLTVSDPERTSAMMQAVFGWHERWRGLEPDGRIGLHVGSEHSYVALYPPRPPAKAQVWPKSRPLNHLGVEVRDLAAAEDRVKAYGLKPYAHADYEPGKRFYFEDWDGIEYEMVSYTAANASEDTSMLQPGRW
ncbi:VOC family protein [Glycocaulis sp.]|uniref:VOC family protein n=1 Tax=Glycocaulis sp. TaxID=1969725 RepID=UPI003D24EDE7